MVSALVVYISSDVDKCSGMSAAVSSIVLSVFDASKRAVYVAVAVNIDDCFVGTQLRGTLHVTSHRTATNRRKSAKSIRDFFYCCPLPPHTQLVSKPSIMMGSSHLQLFWKSGLDLISSLCSNVKDDQTLC